MEEQVLKKLNHLEEEILYMKSLLAEQSLKKEGKKLASLKGILKGIKINEEDIEDAKKSLFKIQ